MNKSVLDHVIKLLSDQTGHKIKPEDESKLEEVISSQMKYYGFSSPHDYYHLLQSRFMDTSDDIWQAFIDKLVNIETYFFRDQDQLSVIENWIIPEIIKNKKKGETLNFLSVGCSTGEETYSLAILSDRFMKKHQNIPIKVIGIDINKQSIEKAKNGYYKEHSFRNGMPDFLVSYFNITKDQWEVIPEIQKMVTFYTCNVLQGFRGIPYLENGNIDLIICRNVFIYFTPQALAAVLSILINALNNDGFLITGHTEISGISPSNLKTIIFPESIVYQKCRTQTSDKSAPPQPLHKAVITNKAKAHKMVSTPSPDFSDALLLFNQGNYKLSIEILKLIISKEPLNSDAYYLLAYSQANMGNYNQAIQSCKQALKFNPLNCNAYFLLALISHALGHIDTQTKYLNKVLYLEPSHIPSHIELAIIYERAGHYSKAIKMRLCALDLLRKLPPNVSIKPYEGISVNDLIIYLENITRV